MSRIALDWQRLSRQMAYFRRSKRITKSMLAFATTPSLANARLRFFDFFVRMWRLKDFWWVIFPVPVTLKRFLALEFVLTFGILECLYCYTLEAFSTGRNLGSLFRQCLTFSARGAKIGVPAHIGDTRNRNFVKAHKKRLPAGSLSGLVLAYFLITTFFVSVSWPSSKIFSRYSPEVINDDCRLK